jgi:hypothetical protein
MFRDYPSLLSTTLARNMPLLFDLHGSEVELSYQRHVVVESNQLAYRDDMERRKLSVQLAADLWAVCEMHIRRSEYSRPHHGAVHVEADWFTPKGKSPPCVLLLNTPFREEGEALGELPCELDWVAEPVLGPLAVRSFVFDNCGRRCRAWRIYLDKELAK